jgi:hypothetical protein
VIGIEQVIFELLVYGGKLAMDRLLKGRESQAPTIPQGGNPAATVGDARLAPPVRSGAVFRDQEHEVLRGVFCVQQSVRRAMHDDEQAFILLLNKNTKGYIVSGKFPPHKRYEMFVVPGVYSMFMVLLDSGANSLLAVGFPSRLSLPRRFGFDTPDYAWDLVAQSPRLIERDGGPYNMSFVVLGLNDLPERPASFAHLEAIRDNYARGSEAVAENPLTPDAGYAWVNKRNTDDLRVAWQPGVDHPDDERVIASDEEGTWTPDAGYAWVNKRNTDDLRVAWQPGVDHPDHEHVIASDEEGEWIPDTGYDWVNKRKTDMRVKWQRGVEHPDHKHVIAADQEGVWTPAPRYQWVDGSEGSWRVKRQTSR